MKFKITRANENKFESGLRGFFEYKGKGEFKLYPGDVVYQPPEIHHREIEHSDDLELIEITSPSEFETIKL